MIGKSSISQQHHILMLAQQPASFSQQQSILLEGNSRTAMLQDSPQQWHCTPTTNNGQVNHAIAVPQDGGVQSKIQPMMAPSTERNHH
jgi:hypothetical protein